MFKGRFALGPLNLSFLEVTLAGQVTAALVTVLVIAKLGRLIDRYGSKPVMFITCIMTAIVPSVMLFAQPGEVITFFLLHFIGAAFWNATNLACVNMQMSYSPDDQRPAYIAIFTCVTSLFGAFLGVFLGGAFLEWIPGFMHQVNFTIGGGQPDKFKVLFALGVIFRLLAVLVFVPRLENDRESSIRELAGDVKEWLKDHSPSRFYRAYRVRALRKKVRRRKRKAGRNR
jgi:MFS family permease